MSNKTEDQWKAYSRIHENYNYMNQMMIREIELASVHGGVTGNYREGMWVKFFRGIVPLKYSLAQGVILIDSEGNISKEVDIAIFDEQYTPYVFQYNSLKFIPIEAVVIAIECKSTSYDRKALLKWCDSIIKLKPNRTGIARVLGGQSIGLTNQTQTRTRPLRILTTMKPGREEKDQPKLEQQSDTDKDPRELEEVFDFIINETTIKDSNLEKKEFTVQVNNKSKSLQWWSRELNQCNLAVEKDKDCLPLKLHMFDASVIKDHKELNELQTKLKEKKAQEEKKSRREKKLRRKKMQEEKEEITNLTNKINGLAKGHFEELYPELRFNSNLELENTLEDLEVPGNSLLTLNLQINQLLMLLNNPMLFPHFAYAKAFKEAIEMYDKGERKEKTK